ncbi:hypothetical protein [Pseudosulfitobacter sp. DSM 107133]|jgi:hypothetical protein|uniref:hypothetical protein n=1 Tax=Pseudosulfitobacter sp. DSM 107133 TaxID=2883100 RepID=UPI000DF3FDE4|nr:hypothetical protein [Pseudosulfitobacter sp. DSM 107133]UOA28871.1 hypothetical protein DSM107133_03630 [Pseudosulfitobacter sp. DSM 107133]
MRGIAHYFMLAAVISVVLGMIWGLQMAISGDHTMLPAHAHLNLVGWVTLALFAIYYHLVPAAGEGLLARVHLVVAIVGVIVMVPGIAVAHSGGPEIAAAVGSLITFASMLIFLATVVLQGRQS